MDSQLAKQASLVHWRVTLFLITAAILNGGLSSGAIIVKALPFDNLLDQTEENRDNDGCFQGFTEALEEVAEVVSRATARSGVAHTIKKIATCANKKMREDVVLIR